MSGEGDNVFSGRVRQRRSNSRRSSILKSNKSPTRTALGELDPNAYKETENEVINKHKSQRKSRRVSFADTCQVKEFVNWAGLESAAAKNVEEKKEIAGLESLLTGTIQHVECTESQEKQIQIVCEAQDGFDPTQLPGDATVMDTFAMEMTMCDDSGGIVEADPEVVKRTDTSDFIKSLRQMPNTQNLASALQLHVPEKQFTQTTYQGAYDVTDENDFSTLMNTSLNKHVTGSHNLVGNGFMPRADGVKSTEQTRIFGQEDNDMDFTACHTANMTGKYNSTTRSEISMGWSNESTKMFDGNQSAFMDMTTARGGGIHDVANRGRSALSDKTVMFTGGDAADMDMTTARGGGIVDVVNRGRTALSDKTVMFTGGDAADMDMTRCVNQSMNITRCVSQSLPSDQLYNNARLPRADNETTRLFNADNHDASMDFTACLGNIVVDSTGGTAKLEARSFISSFLAEKPDDLLSMGRDQSRTSINTSESLDKQKLLNETDSHLSSVVRSEQTQEAAKPDANSFIQSFLKAPTSPSIVQQCQPTQDADKPDAGGFITSFLNAARSSTKHSGPQQNVVQKSLEETLKPLQTDVHCSSLQLECRLPSNSEEDKLDAHSFITSFLNETSGNRNLQDKAATTQPEVKLDSRSFINSFLNETSSNGAENIKDRSTVKRSTSEEAAERKPLADTRRTKLNDITLRETITSNTSPNSYINVSVESEVVCQEDLVAIDIPTTAREATDKLDSRSFINSFLNDNSTSVRVTGKPGLCEISKPRDTNDDSERDAESSVQCNLTKNQPDTGNDYSRDNHKSIGEDISFKMNDKMELAAQFLSRAEYDNSEITAANSDSAVQCGDKTVNFKISEGIADNMEFTVCEESATLGAGKTSDTTRSCDDDFRSRDDKTVNFKALQAGEDMEFTICVNKTISHSANRRLDEVDATRHDEIDTIKNRHDVIDTTRHDEIDPTRHDEIDPTKYTMEKTVNFQTLQEGQDMELTVCANRTLTSHQPGVCVTSNQASVCEKENIRVDSENKKDLRYTETDLGNVGQHNPIIVVDATIEDKSDKVRLQRATSDLSQHPSDVTNSKSDRTLYFKEEDMELTRVIDQKKTSDDGRYSETVLPTQKADQTVNFQAIQSGEDMEMTSCLSKTMFQDKTISNIPKAEQTVHFKSAHEMGEDMEFTTCLGESVMKRQYLDGNNQKLLGDKTMNFQRSRGIGVDMEMTCLGQSSTANIDTKRDYTLASVEHTVNFKTLQNAGEDMEITTCLGKSLTPAPQDVTYSQDRTVNFKIIAGGENMDLTTCAAKTFDYVAVTHVDTQNEARNEHSDSTSVLSDNRVQVDERTMNFMQERGQDMELTCLEKTTLRDIHSASKDDKTVNFRDVNETGQDMDFTLCAGKTRLTEHQTDLKEAGDLYKADHYTTTQQLQDLSSTTCLDQSNRAFDKTSTDTTDRQAELINSDVGRYIPNIQKQGENNVNRELNSSNGNCDETSGIREPISPNGNCDETSGIREPISFNGNCDESSDQLMKTKEILDKESLCDDTNAEQNKDLDSFETQPREEGRKENDDDIVCCKESDARPLRTALEVAEELDFTFTSGSKPRIESTRIYQEGDELGTELINPTYVTLGLETSPILPGAKLSQTEIEENKPTFVENPSNCMESLKSKLSRRFKEVGSSSSLESCERLGSSSSESGKEPAQKRQKYTEGFGVNDDEMMQYDDVMKAAADVDLPVSSLSISTNRNPEMQGRIHSDGSNGGGILEEESLDLADPFSPNTSLSDGSKYVNIQDSKIEQAVSSKSAVPEVRLGSVAHSTMIDTDMPPVRTEKNNLAVDRSYVESRSCLGTSSLLMPKFSSNPNFSQLSIIDDQNNLLLGSEKGLTHIEDHLRLMGVHFDDTKSFRRSTVAGFSVKPPETLSDYLQLAVTEPEVETYQWACDHMSKLIDQCKDQSEILNKRLMSNLPEIFNKADGEGVQAMQRMTAVCRKKAHATFKEWRSKMLKTILEAVQEEEQFLVEANAELENKMSEAELYIQQLQTEELDLDDELAQLESRFDSSPVPCEQLETQKKVADELKKVCDQLAQSTCELKTKHEKLRNLHDLKSARLESLKSEEPKNQMFVEDLSETIEHLSACACFEVEKWEDNCADFSFIWRTLWLHLEFNGTVEETFARQPAKEVTSIKFISKPSGKESSLETLIHKLVLDAADQQAWLSNVKTTADLPNLFKSLSPVVIEAEKLMREIEFVGISHMMHVRNTEILVEFSSLKAWKKFNLVFVLDQCGFRDSAIHWSFHPVIGDWSVEDIEKIATKVTPGSQYLTRLVKAIDTCL